MLMPPPYSQMHNGILRAYNESGNSNIINRTRELQGLHMDRYSFPIKLAVTKVAQTGTLASNPLMLIRCGALNVRLSLPSNVVCFVAGSIYGLNTTWHDTSKQFRVS